MKKFNGNDILCLVDDGAIDAETSEKIASFINEYLRTERSNFESDICKAFMAGQIDCGVDPSWASAQEYVIGIGRELPSAGGVPDLNSDGSRRECLIEVQIHGLSPDYFIAIYNETVNKWNPIHGVPVDQIPTTSVTRWAYIEDIFRWV